jgi:hypothetical protein
LPLNSLKLKRTLSKFESTRMGMSMPFDSYAFTFYDSIEVLKFCRDYHLEETKAQTGRTGTGPRGFGGEIDAFGIGKFNEIGIAKALSGFQSKKCLIDNQIYSNAEVGRVARADIVGIKTSSSKIRAPRVHVEIKLISESDEWLGIPAVQLQSILREEQNDLSGLFLVFGEVFFQDTRNAKQRDILGAFLKRSLTGSVLDFSQFSDLKDLRGRLVYALNLGDLSKFWHLFPAGEIIPRPILMEAKGVINRDGSLRRGLHLISQFSGKREMLAKTRNGDRTQYGKFKVSGEIQLIGKRDSQRRIIRFLSPGKIESEFFGRFEMREGQTIYFNIENMLAGAQGNQVKTKDDYWISRRRLNQLMEIGKIPDTNSAIKNLRKLI